MSESQDENARKNLFCPTCGALTMERCVTRRGVVRGDHKARRPQPIERPEQDAP